MAHIAVKDFTSGSAKQVRATTTSGGSPDATYYLPHHNMGGGDYEACGASATTTLGGTGAVGDVLAWLTIVPATTGAGDVSIKDGADSAILVFKSGTLADLSPIVLPLFATSRTGAWQVVTGSNVTAFATGTFS